MMKRKLKKGCDLGILFNFRLIVFCIFSFYKIVENSIIDIFDYFPNMRIYILINLNLMFTFI
jgi:hypothetical protein